MKSKILAIAVLLAFFLAAGINTSFAQNSTQAKAKQSKAKVTAKTHAMKHKKILNKKSTATAKEGKIMKEKKAAVKHAKKGVKKSAKKHAVKKATPPKVESHNSGQQ